MFVGLGRFAALFFLLSGALWAGPPLTTIQDVLYRADGTRLNADATISWSSFDAYDTSVIGMQSITVPIRNGVLYVQLVPNTNATPVGYYTVAYESDGRIQSQETWSVPLASHPLRVRDVRVANSATASGSGSGGTGAATSPIPESSVVGLLPDLSARPVKGPGFGTGRTALVNPAGGIETVVGNLSDCVHVDGTSGACTDPNSLPSYSDAETPGGVVDGSNNSFSLASPPSPAASLVLFRNGLAMNPGADYVLNGSTLTFVAAAVPQPQDTLLAWYRIAAAGNLSAGGLTNGHPAPGTTFLPLTAQVLCSATGSATTSAVTTSLGNCVIPGNLLKPGDRVEVEFEYQHTGTAATFAVQVLWGSSLILQRAGMVSDTALAGRAEAMVGASASTLTSQSFGSVSPLQPAISMAPGAVSAGIKIDLRGSIGGAPDSLQLTGYTVLRYPAISHP